MSKRVKGIVVEIGGDTGPLDKALQGTNKNISTTQGKLKDVERLLKLDPTNTNLLAQKQKLLAEAISETENKLETLNKANDQVADSVKNYDTWKAAYDPIQAEIDTTNQKLKDLRARQDEMKDRGEIDTEAYKVLTEEIQNTSKELRDLKNQAKAVSDEFGNPVSPDQYDSLQREIAATEIGLRDLKAKAEKTEKAINGVDEDPIEDVADAARKAGDALGDAAGEASVFGDVLKAEALVEGAKGLLSGLKDAAEETKEYRKIMGSLEVSSEAAGYSAQQTKDAYNDLFGVLADDQSSATTLANLQALGVSQETMMELINATIGGWAKYGDSIPIDGLAEAINETVKAGQVTGTFADILNWGAKEGETYGVTLKENIEFTELSSKKLKSLTEVERAEYEAKKAQYEAIEDYNNSVMEATGAEDMFNIALQNCSTEAERLDLVMQAMTDQGLAAAGEKWKENNAAIVEANEAQAEFTEKTADLAERATPAMTAVQEGLSQVLDVFLQATESIDMDAIAAAISTAFAVISELITFLIEHHEIVLSVLVGIGAGLAALRLAEMISTLSMIKAGVITLAEAFPVLGNAISILTNPVFIVTAAVVGLVALIATKGDEIQAILQNVDAFMQGVFAKDWTEVFGPVLGGALNSFFAKLKEIWDSVMLIFNGVIDFIRGVFTGDWERAWSGVVQIFEGIFQGLVSIAKTPINAVISLINSAIAGINSLISNVNKIPGISIPTIGKLPMLADGGEVFRGSAIVGEAGPELLTVAADRTIVQPLTTTTHNRTNHWGGFNVYVYGAPGQSEDELADRVMERMQQKVDSEGAGL